MSKMTEAIQQAASLAPLGFSAGEIEALTRCANVLHRWDEAECNGEVEVDEDGKAYRVYGMNGGGPLTRLKTANREAAAWKRAQSLAAGRGYTLERQGDPRGIPFYVLADGLRVGLRVAVCWI